MPDLSDALIVIGAVGVVVGVALFSLPAALVVAGLLLVLFGLTAAGRRNGTAG